MPVTEYRDSSNMAAWRYDEPLQPRLRCSFLGGLAYNTPIILSWTDEGDVDVKIGELLLERVMRRSGGAFYLDTRVARWKTRNPIVAFELLLEHSSPNPECDNNDCVVVPDGRSVDLQ